MRKMLLVLRHELITTVARPSFVIVALALPLLTILIMAIVPALGKGAAANPAESVSQATEEIKAEGYVDSAAVIHTIPDDLAGKLLPYADEDAARQALARGEIAGYYLISADYIKSGRVIYVFPGAQPFSRGQEWVIHWALLVNLLGGDTRMASRVMAPMNVEVTSLAPTEQPQREESNALTFFLPFVAAMILYMILVISSSLLLDSMNNEKKNRVIEILMQSVSPPQILAGKIVGRGIAGLIAAIFWIGGGYVALRMGTSGSSAMSGFALPFSVVAWAILLFVLGYAIYASLIAGLGALASSTREANQLMGLVLMPILVPLILISILTEAPNGALAVVLSLFPLTAPVAMLARLTAGAVPWWQPALAAGLLLLTVVFIVRAVARLFRAQAILSGESFSLPRYLRALAGKG